jgi:hypothetical protein
MDGVVRCKGPKPNHNSVIGKQWIFLKDISHGFDDGSNALMH